MMRIHKEQAMPILRDLRVSAVLLLLPVIALIAGLIDMGAWSDALAAWQGKFTMFGLPKNPWSGSNGIIATFTLLSLLYLLLCAGAFASVRYIRLAWMQCCIAAVLILSSTFSFFIMMLYGSIVWAEFRDVLISPGPAHPLLIAIAPLIALIGNTMSLIDIARHQ
jgi:hypothetical protein